ncbi:MAG TPA: ABC transporter ATP-binding protein [Parachlamydiaceae bacterium]|nr:ABC transporter ATP-binding protein [Parachlamydiaceae bacterium]
MDLNEPVLKVNKLSAGVHIEKNAYFAVQDLSFDLFKGKTLALVGESGCGKTFAALSIMRLLSSPPAFAPSGEVIYKGENLLVLPESKMRSLRGGKIAMIFQNPSSALNPVYRIGDQLLEAVALHRNLFGKEAMDCALQALDDVQVPDPHSRFFDYPHQLSGGMKQRIMIAMALIGRPDILIADEPTTALDVTIQQQVLGLIRNLQEKNKMAVLLITHDMGVVAEMAHNVVVMYAAMGIESGSVAEIFDHMAHPYTIGLFKSRPDQNSKKGELAAIKGSVPPITNYPKGCRFHPRCPFVMERCKLGEIPDFIIGGNEKHKAKCLLYDGKNNE